MPDFDRLKLGIVGDWLRAIEQQQTPENIETLLDRLVAGNQGFNDARKFAEANPAWQPNVQGGQGYLGSVGGNRATFNSASGLLRLGLPTGANVRGQAAEALIHDMFHGSQEPYGFLTWPSNWGQSKPLGSYDPNLIESTARRHGWYDPSGYMQRPQEVEARGVTSEAMKRIYPNREPQFMDFPPEMRPQFEELLNRVLSGGR